MTHQFPDTWIIFECRHATMLWFQRGSRQWYIVSWSARIGSLGKHSFSPASFFPQLSLRLLSEMKWKMFMRCVHLASNSSRFFLTPPCTQYFEKPLGENDVPIDTGAIKNKFHCRRRVFANILRLFDHHSSLSWQRLVTLLGDAGFLSAF